MCSVAQNMDNVPFFIRIPPQFLTVPWACRGREEIEDFKALCVAAHKPAICIWHSL